MQVENTNTIKQPKEEKPHQDILAFNDSSFDSRNLSSNHAKQEAQASDDEALMNQLEQISPSEVK